MARVAGAPVLLAVWGSYPSNPWQRIMCDAIPAKSIIELDHGASLESLLPKLAAGARVVLHVNWTAQLSQPGTAAEARQRVDDAIAELVRFKAAGGTVLWTVHNVQPHELHHVAAEHDLVTALAELADGIHVMNPHTRSLVAGQWTIDVAKQHIIPHPSYVGVYRDDIARDDARAVLGIPSEAKVVLAHGLLRNYKGLAELCASFVRAADSDPQLWLLIAGAKGAGFDETNLEAVAAHPRVIVHQEFVEPDDVQVWHRAANAAVLPYSQGLNSGALMLATTFGLPVVAFPCAAALEYVGSDWLVIAQPDSPDWLTLGLSKIPHGAAAAASAAAFALRPAVVAPRFARMVHRLGRARR